METRLNSEVQSFWLRASPIERKSSACFIVEIGFILTKTAINLEFEPRPDENQLRNTILKLINQTFPGQSFGILRMSIFRLVTNRNMTI